MLMNLQTCKWDPYLISFFDVPEELLPRIRSSSEIYGNIENGVLHGIPISGVKYLLLIFIFFLNILH